MEKPKSSVQAPIPTARVEEKLPEKELPEPEEEVSKPAQKVVELIETLPEPVEKTADLAEKSFEISETKGLFKFVSIILYELYM